MHHLKCHQRCWFSFFSPFYYERRRKGEGCISSLTVSLHVFALWMLHIAPGQLTQLLVKHLPENLKVVTFSHYWHFISMCKRHVLVKKKKKHMLTLSLFTNLWNKHHVVCSCCYKDSRYSTWSVFFILEAGLLWARGTMPRNGCQSKTADRFPQRYDWLFR